MKLDKTIFLFTLLLFLVPSVVMAEKIVVTDADSIWTSDLTTVSSDVIDSTDAPSENLITEAFVSHADSVWSPELTPVSSDVIDSTDAPSGNLIKYAFVSHADSIWTSDLTTVSSDVIDSTDAPSENLITWAFVSHADSVWSTELKENGWEAEPDFWIEEIKPVQVVWASKIDDNDTIDLVAGKSTMVRVEVRMKDYELLDNQELIGVKLTVPKPSNDFIIPKIYSVDKTIEQLEQNGNVDFYIGSFTSVGDYTIRAEIYPKNEIEELKTTNNENSVAVTVKDTHGLDIKYSRVERPKSYGGLYYPYNESAEKSGEYIQSTYPIRDGAVYPLSEDAKPKEIVEGHIKLPLQLGIRWDCSEVGKLAKRLGFDLGVGIVPYGYFDYHGVPEAAGYHFFTVTNGVVAEAGYWTTIAHEVGHKYGLDDEYTKNYDGNSANGFWVDKSQSIENLLCFMGKAMGYESFDSWICNDCYSRLFKKFRKDKNDPEILVVDGTIYKDETIELGRWYKVKEGKDDLDKIVPGDYSLQILDQDKNILQQISFSAKFWANADPIGRIETDFAPFSFAIPYPQTGSVAKIFHKDEIIAEFDLSTKLLEDGIESLPFDYDMLIKSIEEANIQHGIKNSLISKLTNAKRQAESGAIYIKEGRNKQGKNRLNSASNIVNTFINEVNTQKEKKISKEDANRLISWAEKIILALQDQIIKNL